MSDEQTPIPIQIRLNSERAIRQIVAGDPELEISIKKSIMENFAKSYEQILINSVNTTKIAELIQKQLEDSIIYYARTKYKNGMNCGSPYMKLRPEIEELIKKAVDGVIHENMDSKLRTLQEDTDKKIDDLYDKINTRYEKTIEKITADIIRNVTSKVMEDIVEERVQSRLKAIKENL